MPTIPESRPDFKPVAVSTRPQENVPVEALNRPGVFDCPVYFFHSHMYEFWSLRHSELKPNTHVACLIAHGVQILKNEHEHLVLIF